MQYKGLSKLTLLLSVFALLTTGLGGQSYFVHAAESYKVDTFPPLYAQEGTVMAIVLSVSGASFLTQYEFQFGIRDPSTAIWTSNSMQHTTGSEESSFSIIIFYPSPDFPSPTATSLVGIYYVGVTQLKPTLKSNVATTAFYIGLTDKLAYQRTETVSIVATGYTPSERADIAIRTSITSTLVYSNTVTATSTGQVIDSWLIPKDTTVNEGYVVTVTGTVTAKSPADAWGFNIRPALMSVPIISSSQSSYQRTETMTFSFQPSYPNGEIATTGSGLLILKRPDGATITLTANYDGPTQNFVATYKTTATNQTGTWNATLASYRFGDGYGNSGPDSPLSALPLLQQATFSVTIQTKTSFAPFEQVKFNATIQYPDGTVLQNTAGTSVTSTLSYSGGGHTVSPSVSFDGALQLWVGSYTPQGNEPSGQWSLTVQASDSAQPANFGSQTRVVQIQNRPPTAAFTPSSNNAQAGTAITFDATTSSDLDGSIISYLWDFGDGSSGSGQTSSHSYATSGNYIVRLTVTDNSGATSTANSTVIIQGTIQTGDNASFPLYYFAIIAGLIAAILGGFMAFRRRKVTHAKLKIDLEAVRSEAGRIENQEFFQSVREQLKKDKEQT